MKKIKNNTVETTFEFKILYFNQASHDNLVKQALTCYFELVYSVVHTTICHIWTELEVDISGIKSPKYTQPKDYKPVFFCVLGG